MPQVNPAHKAVGGLKHRAAGHPPPGIRATGTRACGAPRSVQHLRRSPGTPCRIGRELHERDVTDNTIEKDRPNQACVQIRPAHAATTGASMRKNVKCAHTMCEYLSVTRGSQRSRPPQQPGSLPQTGIMHAQVSHAAKTTVTHHDAQLRQANRQRALEVAVALWQDDHVPVARVDAEEALRGPRRGRVL